MNNQQNFGEKSTTATCSLSEQFDTVIKMMLDPANPKIYMIPFIKHKLRQFNLKSFSNENESFCNESDVFNEVYLRAKYKIFNGEHIEKIPEWFRGAVVNVLKEIRKEKKVLYGVLQRLYKSDVVDEIDPQLHDYATIQNCKQLREYLKSIREDDRELILLHWGENMSWKEIGDLLVTKGKEVEYNKQVEQKLRQRGNRALKRLRAKFIQ